ncbi:hypothetical protein LEP1GSC057_0004 [Leptospira interrogans str. Brem 329]|nr:hypothetical protein LEP1GSC057_0004 [Leptospira interrogans str. Brem 329]
MKHFLNIFFVGLLLVGCASESGENSNASQLLLGIVNHKQLNLAHPERNSELRILDIPTHYVDSISGNNSNAGTKSAPTVQSQRRL